MLSLFCFFFFFQAEDGIRDYKVTGVQTCALPILARKSRLESDVLARRAERIEALESYAGRFNFRNACVPLNDIRVHELRDAPRTSEDLGRRRRLSGAVRSGEDEELRHNTP